MATSGPALVSHAPLRSSNRLYTVSHTLDKKSWHSEFLDIAVVEVGGNRGLRRREDQLRLG